MLESLYNKVTGLLSNTGTLIAKKKNNHYAYYVKQGMSHQNVLQCRRDEDRKDRNMKDNTEEEWEEVVQIFRKKKKKEKEERKFRKKEAV